MRDDWYDHPVWYDILHQPGTAREVRGLERIETRFVAPELLKRRVWLEPACGTGRYLRIAASRGARVVGFDLNPRMVEYARQSLAKRALRGKIFVADMTSFDLGAAEGRVTFAFCPINTIRHLPSDRAMLDHLRVMRRALAPGGVYAVGIETCRYGLEFPTEDVWRGSRGGTTITQLIQYTPPKRRSRIERVFSHLRIETGSATEHLDSAYDLRAYSAREWDALVRRARWRTIAICNSLGQDALRGPRGQVVGGYGLHVLVPD